MKRYTKMDKINDLIRELNHQRIGEGKPPVKRAWTGVGNWLMTDEENYKSVGGVFTKEDEFIGFLEGLTFKEES